MELGLTEPGFRLTIGHGNLSLCKMAESKLQKASQSGALIFGHDLDSQKPVIVVKYVGKLVGFSLADYQLPNGQMLVKNNWYVPVSPKTQEELEQSFQGGNSNVFEFNDGVWALMRGFRHTEFAGRVLLDLQSLSANPDTFPTLVYDPGSRKNIPPAEFRVRHFESIWPPVIPTPGSTS